MRAIMVLFSACVALGTPSSMCFGNATCWSWAVSGDMINFNATCGDGPSLGWCAFGINLSGSNMAPAEVFWISHLSNGAVTIEDRFNPHKHDAPVCTKQISTGAGQQGNDGTLTAQWSRPLIASGEGLTSITPGKTVSVIAAWGTLDGQASKSCETWDKHVQHWSGTTTF